ncbi:glucose-6-phosphate isomerase [Candidatus Persebacteraceae bacterium Df01]|uniref:Glucose-6-phosphate isomerase n=1 Tax=Candidatus Doriopsillibacter californiensis TaxID=2970740 RepID=A0ABT7QL54_9GAMM|nr:glucose-6-phosphate isomerase [Candidatus Persebacteraceae bacterium Df01]
MFTTSGIEQTHAWKELQAHQRTLIGTHTLRQLFAEDSARFDNFSLQLDDLLMDFSKVCLTAKTVSLLIQLAQAAGVEARRDALFSGDAVNDSEDRPALHTALRSQSKSSLIVGSIDIMTAIRQSQARLIDFAKRIRHGNLTATNEQPFTDVVSIGIGGSDLGPRLVATALRSYHDGPRLHFVSNIDGTHFADIVATLDPCRTLFIVSSKSFSTTETLANAEMAKNWLAHAVGDNDVWRHFAAATAAPEKAAAFGVARECIFELWGWVGGRYSLWSAIGLPLLIAVGTKHFFDLLSGAHCMDKHFCAAPVSKNLPLMLGLVGVWHRNFFRYPTRAVLPYSHRLRHLPAYLQQLDMESNGKQAGAGGRTAVRHTGPVVWGATGSNAQHAFFQLLHQGTDVVPCEFVAVARSHDSALDANHRVLLANCLAQSEALLHGTSGDIEPHRRCVGGRPSITLLFEKITPFTLGRLLALYEHRTFVESVIWGVNAFDQWGVELGKSLIGELLTVMDDEGIAGKDSSTRGQAAHLRRLR